MKTFKISITARLKRLNPYMFKSVKVGCYRLSIQASAGHYCTPRETLEKADQYVSFELAVINRKGRLMNIRRSSVLKAFPRYNELIKSQDSVVHGWVAEDLLTDLYYYLKER